MYKEGQSFLEFAGEKYGKQRVLDILENIWTNSYFQPCDLNIPSEKMLKN